MKKVNIAVLLLTLFNIYLTYNMRYEPISVTMPSHYGSRSVAEVIIPRQEIILEDTRLEYREGTGTTPYEFISDTALANELLTETIPLAEATYYEKDFFMIFLGRMLPIIIIWFGFYLLSNAQAVSQREVDRFIKGAEPSDRKVAGTEFEGVVTVLVGIVLWFIFYLLAP